LRRFPFLSTSAFLPGCNYRHSHSINDSVELASEENALVLLFFPSFAFLRLAPPFFASPSSLLRSLLLLVLSPATNHRSASQAKRVELFFLSLLASASIFERFAFVLALRSSPHDDQDACPNWTSQCVG
jgi:hypothetical protein